MKRTLFGILMLLAVVCSFVLVGDAVWALKNVCPSCNKVIDNLDLTACPSCGKVINKCLVCGKENPVKNDHCSRCSATMAESRILDTIATETRDDLQLGESPRAKIEVELRQLAQKATKEELTSVQAARKVELLTEMGWWSEVDSTAAEFATKYPGAAEQKEVTIYRLTALRNMAFLALEAKDPDLAKGYLKTARSIDPRDPASREPKEAKEPKEKTGESK